MRVKEVYHWDVDNTKAYNNKMGRYKTQYVLDFINRYAKSSMRVLDVGGGSGRFALPLYEKGNDILVVEKNKAAVDILSSRCPEIECIIGDFNDLEFDEAEKFDLIILIEVLLYFKDWSKTLRKLYGLLKDDGVIIFTATNANSWRFLSKIIFKDEIDYTILSIKEYKVILKQSDFVTDQIEGFLWIPCKLNSNSIFVNIFSFIEKTLRLNRFIAQSPWLLFAIRKKQSLSNNLVKSNH